MVMGLPVRSKSNQKAHFFALVLLLVGTILLPIGSATTASSAQNFSPKWVKNCIQVYSQISKTYEQQCDQVYATAPGKWVKNCIQVYSQVFRTYEQQCAQAYITGTSSGTWKKNCIQVYNQAFRTYEQKCTQTFIAR